MEWSKGVIFLMATFWPEGLCIAELHSSSAKAASQTRLRRGEQTHQTTPYAPSPTTSWISYCSLTLKEILREPAGFGGWARDMVEDMAEAGLATRSKDGVKCYAPGGRQKTGSAVSGLTTRTNWPGAVAQEVAQRDVRSRDQSGPDVELYRSW